MAIFKIHPAIGIARLGDSDAFYLSPEQSGALPIACDNQGRATIDDDQEKRVEKFKDDLGRIKRQAARFCVFVYDEVNDIQGRELKVGDKFTFELETPATGRQAVEGTVTDVEWTVHLANKKSSWYAFLETDGMHGYPPSHPLRNPDVTQPDERRKLIIDPGPQTVSYNPPEARHKQFAQGHNPGYPQTFPPDDIAPNPITTLGELKVNQQDEHVRLIVLGGNGNAGSTGNPILTGYANNDGWFDDVSDGPVTARIQYEYTITYTDQKGKQKTDTRSAYAKVDVPAWVVVGYPRYAPELVDMITMDEAMYDLFVRHLAYDPQIYGVPPYDKASNRPKTVDEFRLWRSQASWNPDYYPKFFKEIWPILKRPDLFGWVYVFDWFGGSDPHNTGTAGNLDEAALSTPPTHDDGDPNQQHRQFIYDIMRQPGQENLYRTGVSSRTIPNYHPRAMPELCGNNPLSNTAPQKFLRMTDTQLFLLKQWAEGKFVNECLEWGESDENCKNPFANPPTTGIGIDRGVLGNVVGGAFCPGAELTWIMLNPAIYSEPYRVKHTQYQAGALSLPKIVADQDGSPAADLAAGLEPGDLTKYLALPWQADFNQCTEQNIDITYENWNNIDLDSTGDPAKQQVAYNVPWWPAHRPITVFKDPNTQVYWASGIPQNNAGGLRMVIAWKALGFIKEKDGSYLMIERNDAALGPPVPPGQRRLGNTKRSEKDG